MPLEYHPLKGWISAHNKQRKQALIRTVTYELTAGVSVTREVKHAIHYVFKGTVYPTNQKHNSYTHF
jgi:hypothetical protein